MNDILQIAYIISATLSMLIQFVTGVFALTRRELRGATVVAFVMLLSTFVTFTYVLVSLSNERDSSFVWVRIRICVLAILIVLNFFFILIYLGLDKILARTAGWFFIIPIFTCLAVWLDTSYNFFFRDWKLEKIGIIAIELPKFSGWAWVHLTYSSLLVVGSGLLLINKLKNNLSPYRSSAFVLLSTFFCTSLFGLQPFFLPGLPNFTVFSLGLTGVGYAWVTFSYRLLNIPAISHLTILGYMQDAVIAVDRINRVVDLNPAAEKVCGQTKGKAIGQPLEKVWPLFADKLSQLEFEVNNGTQIFNVQTVYLNRNNKSSQPDWYAKVYILRDITTLRQTQQALEESEEQLRSIIGSMDDLVFVLDLNGQFLNFYQPSGQNSLYLPPEIFLGKHFSEVLPSPIVKELEQAFTNLKKTGEVQQFDYALEIEKQVHWFNAKLSVLRNPQGGYWGFTAVARNITDRKQAELAIEQREFQYRLLARNIPDTAIFLFDSNLRYQVSEGPFLERYGYTKEMLEGKTVQEVLPPDRTAGVLELYNASLRGEHLYREFERDDMVFTAEALPVTDDNNNILGGLIVSRDVTRQKQLERELQAAKEAAESANNAKSRFLANISHELRTPLNAILGFAELLAADLELKNRHRDKLEIISRSGEHLLILINDILEISKIEAGKSELNLKPVNLAELFNTLYQMFKYRADSKKLAFEFEVASNIPKFVLADESKLRQTLINLLSNALKFTENGFIRLEVTFTTPNKLRFKVEDSGQGIAPEEQKLLFQPFSQTESGLKAQQGSGLGLYITREYVGLMGGRIYFSSQPGEGTCFIFEIEARPLLEELGLPESGQKSNYAKKIVRTIATPLSAPPRILAVDDVLLNAKLVEEWLEKVGFSVECAENGQVALQLVETWQPQLIFLDLRMPGLSGFEVAAQVRAKANPVPIIALTASAFENEVELSQQGFNAYLRKPFCAEDLFQLLADYLQLEYLYEESQENPPAESSHPEDLAAQFVKVTDLQVAEFKQAVAALDIDLTRQVVKEIGQSEPYLAATLEKLIEAFRFDLLADIAEKIPLTA